MHEALETIGMFPISSLEPHKTEICTLCYEQWTNGNGMNGGEQY